VEPEANGVKRREFIRRAALTGAALSSLPVISTIVARPAYAGTPQTCDWSGCVGACAQVWKHCGGPPGQVCQDECTNVCGGRPPHSDCSSCVASCDVGFWHADCTHDAC
jgi:hypothetical protein